MDFHDYKNVIERWRDSKTVSNAFFVDGRPPKPAEFRRIVLANWERLIRKGHTPETISRGTIELAHDCYREILWIDAKRPYYNVWPPIFDLIENFRLETVTSKNIADLMPVPVLCFRLPKEHTPFGIETVIIALMEGANEKRTVDISWWLGNQGFRLKLDADEEKMAAVETWDVYDAMSNHMLENSEAVERFKKQRFFCTKLVSVAVMLATDARIIQPVVLAKDRHQFTVTADEHVKQLLATRAINKTGAIGHDLGREIHEDRERGGQSPHYRNCHLCLFWTGKGRSTPVVKLRAGSMILPHKLREIPTGYLGAEEQEVAT